MGAQGGPQGARATLASLQAAPGETQGAPSSVRSAGPGPGPARGVGEAAPQPAGFPTPPQWAPWPLSGSFLSGRPGLSGPLPGPLARCAALPGPRRPQHPGWPPAAPSPDELSIPGHNASTLVGPRNTRSGPG